VGNAIHLIIVKACGPQVKNMQNTRIEAFAADLTGFGWFDGRIKSALLSKTGGCYLHALQEHK
jgi:hypothetical protein